MSASDPVVVLGRFPPPIDGQTLATARTAELIEAARPVLRVSTTADEPGATVRSEPRWDWARVAHYLGLRRAIRRRLADAPGAPVLWASVSPHPLGHARDLLATLPALDRAHPLAAVVHRGNFAGVFTSPLTRRTAQRMIERLDAVVFLTESLAEACAPFVPEAKRVVIPNTIGGDLIPDLDVVEGARQRRAERQASGAPARLLYLGGMIASKGYGDVLDAAARLRDRGTPAHVRFAGRWASADDEAAFRRRIDALGLVDTVEVLGPVADRDRVGALLLDADLLVFPTTYPTEAQPLVVLEAFAAGTPVVVTRHAGLPEMVEDGRQGTFTAPHDADALADAVTRALADWRTLSEGARARFEAVYGPAAVRRQWLALLDRLERR